jgi:Flp pilus assembly protein TadG
MRRLTAGSPVPVPRRGSRDDGGAVATLVAVLLGSGVLLGMAALTVDVGQVYAERRQVQNGADAAALAVAAACATSASCDTSTAGVARSMANENANDATTAVTSVCGSGHAGLPACPGDAGPVMTGCPAPPASAQGWVQVSTLTMTTSGSTLLPPAFARALAGNAGYTGTPVQACAQAAWGPPAGLDDVVPLILSECEWDAATNNGTTFAGRAPYPPYPTGEVALKLHSTSERGGCPSSGGAYADLPGGFGWLDAGADCQVSVTADGTVVADPGIGASQCGDAVAARVGSVLYLPVYSEAWGSGSSGTYRVSGFAAFYLSGYNLPAAHPSRVASPSGGHLCQGSDKCLYGWFTQGLVPGAGALGHGRPMGATVVAMTG